MFIGCFLLLTRVLPLYLEVVLVQTLQLKSWQAEGIHILTHKDRGLSCEVQLLSFYNVMAPYLLITYFYVYLQSQHLNVKYTVVKLL